jgi:hypothetical protein
MLADSMLDDGNDDFGEASAFALVAAIANPAAARNAATVWAEAGWAPINVAMARTEAPRNNLPRNAGDISRGLAQSLSMEPFPH